MKYSIFYTSNDPVAPEIFILLDTILQREAAEIFNETVLVETKARSNNTFLRKHQV